MTKTDLITALAHRTGMPKRAVADVLSALATTTAASLVAGEDVLLPDIGKLKYSVRAARAGRNPATGEAIEIPARGSVKFQPARALKDLLA